MGGFALTFQYVCKIVSAKIDADPSDAGRLPKTVLGGTVSAKVSNFRSVCGIPVEGGLRSSCSLQ
jgi:hypothetical protein